MPFKSQAQRGLAHAVASGKAKAAAERLIADDPGGKLPAKKCNPCKAKAKSPKSGMSKSLMAAMRRSERRENMEG